MAVTILAPITNAVIIIQERNFFKDHLLCIKDSIKNNNEAYRSTVLVLAGNNLETYELLTTIVEKHIKKYAK